MGEPLIVVGHMLFSEVGMICVRLLAANTRSDRILHMRCIIWDS